MKCEQSNIGSDFSNQPAFFKICRVLVGCWLVWKALVGYPPPPPVFYIHTLVFLWLKIAQIVAIQHLQLSNISRGNPHNPQPNPLVFSIHPCSYGLKNIIDYCYSIPKALKFFKGDTSQAYLMVFSIFGSSLTTCGSSFKTIGSSFTTIGSSLTTFGSSLNTRSSCAMCP